MRRDSILPRREDRRSPAGAPRAVLFDFNGVLIDDEPVHCGAYRDILAPLGVRLTRALYEARYLPLDDFTACGRMLADAGLPKARRTRAAVERLVRAKRRRYRVLLRRRGGAIPAGAVLVVRRLAAIAPLAIVSGAPRSEIAAALRRAGIAACFRVIVSAESVRRSKPDPEGYLKAVRRIAAGRPDMVVALEDSPLGILAARRAGLAVIGVASTYRPTLLRRAGAAHVVTSLARPARVLATVRSAARGPALRKRPLQKRS